MIRIFLGNPGSGKTACAVRDIVRDRSGRRVYSNIRTKGVKNNTLINKDMIIKKVLKKTIKRKSGESEPVYDHRLNIEFWKSVEKPVSVILDEAHTIINARRSMTKVNIVMGDWLALLRRVLGSSDAGYGELTLITQLDNRIDLIARDMATNVRYHRCHYMKECSRCGTMWREHNDIAEPMFECPSCGSFTLRRHSFVVEVWHFTDIQRYQRFMFYNQRSYHKHYLIHDIESVFGKYDTFQWENMISDVY